MRAPLVQMLRPRRWLIVCLVLSALLAGPTALAAAASDQVAVDYAYPTLSPADTGGFKVATGAVNLTPSEIVLQPTLKFPVSGCHLSLDKPKLPPGEHTPETISIPKVCDRSGKGLAINLTPVAAGQAGPAITLTADPNSSPDWDQLRIFLKVGLVALLLMVALWVWWLVVDSKGPWAPWTPLVSMDTAWSFKDTWVSNITVGLALLTGIFASTDVIKPLLGTNADPALALATVGAAISTGLIGVAAVVLIAFKSYRHGAFSVFGLLVSAAVTLTGAGGGAWIAYKTIHQLDLGGAEDLPALLGLIGVLAILVVYSWRSLLDLLCRTTKPPSGAPSETMRVAALIANALGPQDEKGRARVRRWVREAERPPEHKPADEKGKTAAEGVEDEKKRPVPQALVPVAENYLPPGRSALL
jgi:hypothetical protein